MDNATEMKAVAQRTKENVEDLANQAGNQIDNAKENAKTDLTQMVDETKSALDQSVEGAQAQVQTAIADSKDALSDSKKAVEEGINNPSGLISDDVKTEAAEVQSNIENVADKAQSQVQTSMKQAQEAPSETFKGVTRQMADAESSNQVFADMLKRRLDWGEPALTIIDVRHREAFNQERIRGAISMPEADLVSSASDSLEYGREVFIYGDTVTQAEQSVASLQQAGFKKVASISGGIPAWQNAGGATEGIAA